MFVKWSQRSREYQPPWPWMRQKPPHRTIIAQLAESRRVDGKSRQRIIAHLGTCCEPVDQPNHRRWFYERCSSVLDGLNLSASDRAKIDAALAKRIPRLTAEEIAEHNRKWDAMMAPVRPDRFAALVRAWNDASLPDRERFIELLRQSKTS